LPAASRSALPFLRRKPSSEPDRAVGASDKRLLAADS